MLLRAITRLQLISLRIYISPLNSKQLLLIWGFGFVCGERGLVRPWMGLCIEICILFIWFYTLDIYMIR